MLGFGLHLGLHQTPRLAQRQVQICSVCRQYRETYLSAEERACVLALGGPYALCPCCHQETDPSDKNYRRRVRRWVARHG
jgi:hypothetical protein